MLGLNLHRLIFSLFIVIFKASMYGQKMQLLFNSNNKLKTNHNLKYIACNFGTGETSSCFQTKGKVSVSAKIS